MALEFIGYLAGFLVALALTPQIIKTWKTKSAKDISLLWTFILLLGSVLYGFYGFINTIVPLIVSATVESLMVITLIYLKIKYDKK